MRKLAAELAHDFRVISYDRRARGASGDTAPYSVEREIEDLDALITANGGRASLYGVSSGAALALAAAASLLSVEKLVLYEPPFMVGSHARAVPADHNAALSRMIAEGRRGEAVKYYMCDIIGMPRLVGFVFRFTPMWKKMKAVAPSLPYDSAIMGDFALPHARAASVKAPTLVLNGTKTWPVLRDAARVTAAAIPGAKHHSLQGQSHNVAAPVIAPVLREFLKH
jgi:pimeloyl-ACP methyl ester carboxylesterase